MSGGGEASGTYQVSSNSLAGPVSLMPLPPPPARPGPGATLNIPSSPSLPSPSASSGPEILPDLSSAAEVCPRTQPQPAAWPGEAGSAESGMMPDKQ